MEPFRVGEYIYLDGINGVWQITSEPIPCKIDGKKTQKQNCVLVLSSNKFFSPISFIQLDNYLNRNIRIMSEEEVFARKMEQ